MAFGIGAAVMSPLLSNVITTMVFLSMALVVLSRNNPRFVPIRLSQPLYLIGDCGIFINVCPVSERGLKSAYLMPILSESGVSRFLRVG